MIGTKLIFANREALAKSLALDVSRCLSRSITKNGKAVLAVSGGTTPKLFFHHLSVADIAWNKVVVTLVDERQVPESSERSNARLVKAALLQNNARHAKFEALYKNPKADKLPRFSCVVLGMGNDGHTASFFPNGSTLKAALDMKTRDDVIAIEAPGAGEPRLTFSLARLLQAERLMLHIEGAEKEKVLAQAMSGLDIYELPIRAVLNAAKPINIYWSP